MKFYLLGPLEADAGGVPLKLGSLKQRLILAALLLARGRVVSLQDLVEAAWPDDPPSSAVGSLQAYVSRVRGLLRHISSGSVTLVRQPPGYRLDGAVMDLDDFERLSDEAISLTRSGHWETAQEAATVALSLWRGSLLADLPNDSWLLRERRRVDERMERCREALVTALLGRGRTAEALEEARRLLDLQPLRDQAVWLYMMALHRCARSAEALEAYRQHAKTLDEELGLEPVQELRELQTAILREDQALASWPSQPTEAVRATTPSPVRSHATDEPSVRLVGRSRTMTQVESWLTEMCGGAPRWLLLTGPGGIGKTRLAEEVVRRFQPCRGMVAWSGCLHDESVPPWWSLRPLVRQLHGDPDELFRVPEEAHADALRFIVYGRLLKLLHDARAEGPLLVVIDDVQWLDAASARAIAHLLQTLRDVPVGFVLTLRDGPCAPEVSAILAAFARHPAATHVQVTALDPEGVVELLGELAGEPVPASDAMVLDQQTGGNPLLLREYARLPRAEWAAGAIPLAVREVVGRRFDSFGTEALRVLHTAAVAGDGFEPALLAAATGTSTTEVVDVLDAAAHESIIVPSQREPGYQFGHGLLREHLLGELSTVRRQVIHADLAAAIALREGPDEDILRRAQHLSAAMPVALPATVVAACRQAAEYAESVWDWEMAARHWSAARDALGRRRSGKRDLHDEFLVAEVAALAHAGRGGTLLRVVDAALRDASGPRSYRTAARLSGALLRSAGAWPWTAYGHGSSLAVLDRLATASELARIDVRAQVSLLSARAVGDHDAADLRVAEELSRQALSLAEELGDPDALANALIGRVFTIGGVASSGAELLGLLDRLAELPHRQASIDAVLGDNISTMLSFGRGDIAAAERHLRLAVAGSDALRLPVTRAQLRWVEVALAHWRGDLDRADELAVQARERHEQTELYGAEDTYLSARLAIAWDRGTLSEATDEIRRSADPLTWAAAAAAEAGDSERTGHLVRAAIDTIPSPRGTIEGEVPVGRRLLPAHAAGERAEYWYTLGNLCLLAHAVADLGLCEAAPRLLELLAPQAGYVAALGQAAPLGPVSLPVGRLQSLLGDTDGARRAYAEAAEIALRAGAGPSMIRIQAAQAELFPPGPEREHRLRTAAEQASHAGLRGVAQRLWRLADQA